MTSMLSNYIKLFFCLAGLCLLNLSCENDMPQGDKKEETTEPNTNSNYFDQIMDNTMKDLSNEINHQVSDPNSELLQTIDTVKDVMNQKIIDPIKKKVEDQLK